MYFRIVLVAINMIYTMTVSKTVNLYNHTTPYTEEQSTFNISNQNQTMETITEPHTQELNTTINKIEFTNSSPVINSSQNVDTVTTESFTQLTTQFEGETEVKKDQGSTQIYESTTLNSDINSVSETSFVSETQSKTTAMITDGNSVLTTSFDIPTLSTFSELITQIEDKLGVKSTDSVITKNKPTIVDTNQKEESTISGLTEQQTALLTYINTFITQDKIRTSTTQSTTVESNISTPIKEPPFKNTTIAPIEKITKIRKINLVPSFNTFEAWYTYGSVILVVVGLLALWVLIRCAC